MTASLRVSLLLFGASLLGLAISGRTMYASLSYFWFFLIFFSWIWSKFSLYNLNFERNTIIKKGEIGDIFRENFFIENLIKLPRLWLEVLDQSELPGSQGGRVHTLIGSNRTRSYFGRTRLIKRGVFKLGPTTLISGDPFGLFIVKKHFKQSSEILVYPRVEDIDQFPGPAGLLPGGDALKRRTHQVTPNSASIREYLPGDALNRIDWKSSARTDKLMVKEFELDPLAEVWIFVDGEKISHDELAHNLETDVKGIIFGELDRPSLPPSSVEYAASAAASIARYYLRRGRSVGLALLQDREELLPPDKGARQLDKIYERLAFFKSNGENAFTGLLVTQSRRLPRGSTVVVITPSVRSEIPSAIDQIFRLGLRPITVLINAQSFSGPPGTDLLASKISNMGVPVTIISNEDAIGDKLSLAGISGDGGVSIPTLTVDL